MISLNELHARNHLVGLEKPGCFVAGMLVHTNEGLRPIEQIRVGDYVLSKPESGAGEASYKQVVKTFEYDDKEVWYLAFVVFDGAGPIMKTADPRLGLAYNPDTFEDARGIAIDFARAYPEPLRGDDGRLRRVLMDLPQDESCADAEAIDTVLGRFRLLLRKVYNLEVEDNHTYFVGNAGVLVHNTSARSVTSSPRKQQ